MIRYFILIAGLTLAGIGVWGNFQPEALWLFAIVVPLVLLGIKDIFQTRHSIRRNYPIVGHFRYLLESIRPEISQYFIESNSDGVPFSRELRSIVYQRSKKELDTLPFGTQKRVDEVGYEWIGHSLMPKHNDPSTLRVDFGGPECKKPYSASILNVSAMSYGSLSKNAVLALNGAAKIGGFAHNTGEGGLSPYHLQPGGDLIWQIGTAYFSCRTSDGLFSEKLFKEKSAYPQVKMIEIKLSQGAKPSHGGILPAAKVSQEISHIRGVPMGRDVISPPAHTAFSTPTELLEFVAKLRDLSGGKPIGFKLCIGKRREFIAIVKAMIKTGITPDFITIDGGEGGTGAAPLEFSNSVGYPLQEGLVFAHNVLVGMSLRKHVRLIASGKVATGVDLISKFALGADTCNSARAMMMALGCIQALRCNSNKCPTGVATQDPRLTRGLFVPDKTRRVANFHKETVRSVADLLGAMGLAHSSEVRPWHIHRRTGTTEIRHFGEIYPFLKDGELLQTEPPLPYARAFKGSTAETFASVSPF